jgi:hypothetical protein
MLYFNNIEDLPLKNWRKITENGELKYTRTNILNGTLKQDIEHDEKIQDSYIAEFGFTPDFLRIQEIKKDIALAECDLVINDDNFIKNRIKQLNRELEELQNRGTGADMDECIHYIETWRKIEVNEETMKTKKFFKLVKTYQKEIAERKKAS